MQKYLSTFSGTAWYSSLGFAALMTLPLVQALLTTDILLVLSEGASAVVIAGLTVGAFLLLLWLGHQVVLPGLRELPSRERLVFVILMVVAGFVLWVKYPLADLTLTGSLAQMITGSLALATLLLAITKPLRLPHEAPLHWRFSLPVLFFTLYLLLGLHLFSDFGVSSDEPPQRVHGMVMMKHLVTTLDLNWESFLLRLEEFPALEDYKHAQYGTFLQLPLVMQELLKNLPGMASELWLTRHYLTFLFCFVGVAVFYRLIWEKFQYPWAALAGAILLVMTPRIFAHSFFNIKDAVFLMAFIMSLYTAFRFWRRPSVPHALVFGVALAMTINLRIVAVGLLPLPLVILALDALHERWARQRVLGVLGKVVLAVGTLVFTYIAITPAAWSNPVEYLERTVTTFSNYQTWGGDLWFRGQTYADTETPWEYIPVWMFITIPISVQILFLVGLASLVYQVIQRRWSLLGHALREDVLFLGVLILPVAAVIIIGSVLYSGWRHLFFVYAPFLLIAVRGLVVFVEGVRRFRETSKTRYWLGVACAGMLAIYQLDVLRWMIINHPHHTVYYSQTISFVGDRKDFARDYWALSAKQGLEYILENDPRPVVSVTGRPEVLLRTMAILPNDVRRRIVPKFPSRPDYDYFIRIYRVDPVMIRTDMQWHYDIEVDGLPILTIYKAPPQPRERPRESVILKN